MFRKHDRIDSRAMQRKMHLWRYGHFGAPLVVFPSAAGMAHEWEAHGMIEALAELIDGGRIKVYCTESNVAEAWTRKEGNPVWRIERHKAFERFVVGELAPFIREDCKAPEIPIASTGTSLGAFYAVNFTLKYPAVFGYALCMSGRYDTTWLTDGFSNADVYFNNPVAYLPNLAGDELEQVRQSAHIVLVCGQGPWEDGNIESTHHLADLLAAKAIPHERDLWGHDVEHGWAWWRRQARYHLTRAFGG